MLCMGVSMCKRLKRLVGGLVGAVWGRRCRGRLAWGRAALLAGVSLLGWPAAASLDAAQVRSCLRDAAQRYQLDAQLLYAIALVESGLNPRALNRSNANGTRDIGLMQINSSWLPRLAQKNITESDLYDPCVSAEVGAWILADNIARLGATWRAVGAYNARSTARRVAYVRRVQRQLERLRASGQGAPASASAE